MKKFILYTVALLVVIQAIPVTRDNPEFDKSDEIIVSTKVKSVLKKACYDCHSNEVNYSVYSYIAPLSWGVRSHINNGRTALNFSTWKSTPQFIKNARIKKMAQTIHNGRMPLASYIMFHPEAVMSAEEEKVLVDWIQNDLVKEIKEKS